MNDVILLLNPPGSTAYLREYYCSKTPKVPFTYHPVDLYYISGWLAGEYDLRVLDCIAENIGFDGCMKRISELAPAAVISLTGHVSWAEDLRLFKLIAERHGCDIIASGDIMQDESGRRIGGDSPVNAAILDFTTGDIVHYLKKDYEKIRYMHYRNGEDIHLCEMPRDRGIEFEMPMPAIEAFPVKKYHYPFVRRRPFSVVLTDYGCPHSCGFCIMNTVGWKYRRQENVAGELDLLKQNNIREILFMDQTFGAGWQRTEALLNEIIGKKYGFGFVCWTRPDLVDAQRAALLRRAGCHTVMMGAETCSDSMLEIQKKGYMTEDIERGFRVARESGLRTVGTFIFGFPGETAESMKRTALFALRLDPDFASFNMAAPRSGTAMREAFISQGADAGGFDVMDQSGNICSESISQDLFNKTALMMRLAERMFYFRISFIMKSLLRARTLYDLRNLAVSGFSLIAGGSNARRFLKKYRC